ncbi:MAG: 1-acyl-sn-glycerol-3-phosphate acyltransferase [Verrucomicrobia bacterium]|nr:1-acyl-sn-glycerol-3-phosphate acyltransferase [Verrucomicrobiota bacterium]
MNLESTAATCDVTAITGEPSPFRSYLRSLTRLAWLGGEFILAALDYVRHVTFQRELPDAVARALWLQHGCQRILRVSHVNLRVLGPIPTTGLLVCNHLSYLDIIVLGALAPAIFVAKLDVKHWPVFGWFACLAGTVFVHRERRSDVTRANADIQAALNTGVLVVVFAEGTSSDGSTVLPFKSSLLEPAVRSDHPLCAGCLHYFLPDGDAGEEVCYWRDMTLLPHLIKLLGKRGVNATVAFAPLGERSADRKLLARQLRAEVLKLKAAIPE